MEENWQHRFMKKNPVLIWVIDKIGEFLKTGIYISIWVLIWMWIYKI